MKNFYSKYIETNKELWVFFIFTLGWSALLIQHMNVNMYFDDYGNASLSYGYQVPGIIGTDFGISSILEWATWIYNNWGGRILYACAFLIPLLKLEHGITIYMFIQSIIIIIILFIIYRICCAICNRKTSVSAAILTITLFFLIQIPFHNNGTYWATASVLYIWPLLPFLLSATYYNKIIGCINEEKPFNKYAFYFLESIFIFFTTFSQEQWGGALIVFFLFYIVLDHMYNIKKYIKIDAYIIIFSLFTYLLMFLAPGNHVRLNESGDFANLSITGKIARNFPVILDTLMTPQILWITLLMLISTFIYAVKLHNIKKDSLYYRILLILSVSSIVVYGIIILNTINGVFSEIFYICFLILMALISFSYFKTINQIKYFALLISAVASIFCLVFSPYIVERSFFLYIYIVFSYIVIAFLSICKQGAAYFFSRFIIVFFSFIGILNYSYILHGYYQNNYLIKYNVKQCSTWTNENYIILYNYPKEYSPFRSMSISDHTAYEGIITNWVKRYYGITDSVSFIWKDMDDNLTNSLFISLGTSFYPKESSDIESWNWGQKNATLKLYNLYSTPREATFKATISTPQDNDGTVTFTINGQTYSYRINSSDTPIELPLNLNVGANELQISIDVKKVKSKTDSRRLYFMLKNAKLFENE